MWLLRTQNNTVDAMRLVQNEMMKQVLQVQMMLQELLKSGEKAEEARKKIAKNEGEQDQIDAAMAASHPIHFVACPAVCQEDVHQASAFETLRDTVLDVNPTDEQSVYLETATLIGAANAAEHSTFGPGVDQLCLSPQQTATLVAGSPQTDYPVNRCLVHSCMGLPTGGFALHYDSSDAPQCYACLQHYAHVLHWLLGKPVNYVGHSCLLDRCKSPE